MGIDTADYREATGLRAPKSADRGYFTFGVEIAERYFQDDYEGTYAEAKAHFEAATARWSEAHRARYGRKPRIRVILEKFDPSTLEELDLEEPAQQQLEESAELENALSGEDSASDPLSAESAPEEIPTWPDPANPIEIRQVAGRWQAYEHITGHEPVFRGWNDDRITLEDSFLSRGFVLIGECSSQELRGTIERATDHFLTIAKDPSVDPAEVTRYRVFLFALRMRPQRIFTIQERPKAHPDRRFRAVSFDGDEVVAGGTATAVRLALGCKGWVEECFVPEPVPEPVACGNAADRSNCDAECLATEVAALAGGAQERKVVDAAIAEKARRQNLERR